MAKELPSANPPFRPEKAEVLLPDAIRQIIEGTSLPPKEKQRIAIQMASFLVAPYLIQILLRNMIKLCKMVRRGYLQSLRLKQITEFNLRILQ